MRTSKQFTLSVEHILEGKFAARPQAVGLMEVVPLVPQDQTHHNRLFAVPDRDMLLAGNPSYGTVVITNKDSERPLIVPSTTAWVTRHKAQDHAITKAGLVSGGGTVTYDNAACIEASQPGAIPADVYDFKILPATLRRLDRDVVQRADFHKLWDRITALNTALGLTRGGGHLEALFREFHGELAQFVAEFESIPGQIGALILINGELAGIEIAPSPEYWQAVWEPLIRFCYGPEALLTARRLDQQGLADALTDRPRLNTEGVESLSDLELALQSLREAERTRVERLVAQHLETGLHFEHDERIALNNPIVGNVSYELASSYAGFAGQVVLDEDYVVYASLVRDSSPQKRPKRRRFRFLAAD
jgi:hypothetical protein